TGPASAVPRFRTRCRRTRSSPWPYDDLYPSGREGLPARSEGVIRVRPRTGLARGVRRPGVAMLGLFAAGVGLEPRALLAEVQLHGAGRTVALLADDQLRLALQTLLLGLRRRNVILGPAQEHDEIGVLLERAGLAQVGELRAVIGSLLGRARELGQRDDRHGQLLRQRLETPGDLADLLLPVLRAPARVHELDVVHDDEAELGLIRLEPARLGPHLENAQRARVVDPDGGGVEVPRRLREPHVVVIREA